jgi:hypothetical protein
LTPVKDFEWVSNVDEKSGDLLNILIAVQMADMKNLRQEVEQAIFLNRER